jgi:hypothetical protein
VCTSFKFGCLWVIPTWCGPCIKAVQKTSGKYGAGQYTRMVAREYDTISKIHSQRRQKLLEALSKILKVQTSSTHSGQVRQSSTPMSLTDGPPWTSAWTAIFNLRLWRWADWNSMTPTVHILCMRSRWRFRDCKQLAFLDRHNGLNYLAFVAWIWT